MEVSLLEIVDGMYGVVILCMRSHIDFSKKKNQIGSCTLSSHSLVFASMIRYDSSSAVTAPPELELFDTSKTDLPPQLGPTIMYG